jgi:uncharacterized protein
MTATATPTATPARMALALALALLPSLGAAQVRVPPLTGPVVDQAGLLDGAWRERLAALSRSARAREDGTGVQLQYLLVPALQGEAIEDFSIRVAEAWRLGTKGRDNGILVIVAVQDRAFRIEVGGGLEGEIPDALARRIGDQILVPAFRAGRFGQGLYDAGAQLLTLAGVAPEEVAQHARGQRPRGVTRFPSGAGILFALFAVLWILGSVFRGFGPRRRRTLWWGGGPWLGGGWGGGGGGGFGGGGGWSGGGGGFSGGGASGRW